MSLFASIPPAALERLANCPWVRPEAVARGRARILFGPRPTSEQLARSMIEWALGGHTP
jgi:hypothetical protein